MLRRLRGLLLRVLLQPVHAVHASPPREDGVRGRERVLAVLADGTAHSVAVVWGFVGCLGVLLLRLPCDAAAFCRLAQMVM